jgi:hypothetical protein
VAEEGTTANGPASPTQEKTQPEGLGSVMRGMFKRDMQRNEQLVALAGSGLALVLGIVSAISIHMEKTHPKGQAAPGVVLAATAGMAVALWLAARHGSRVITSVVAMAGALFALQGILGFPYIALAGWLLIRNSRTMREQRAARLGTAGGARSAPARPSRESRRSRAEPEPPAAVRREANKRYTPPQARRRGRR